MNTQLGPNDFDHKAVPIEAHEKSFQLPMAQRAGGAHHYVSTSKAILDLILSCVHFQTKAWILGRMWSFQIQLSGKGRACEEFIASKYALFMLKAPLEDGFQASLSPPPAKIGVGTPWISALTFGGNSKGIIDQSQPKGVVKSFTLRSRNSWGMGLWMTCLIGPRLVQQSD